MAFIGNTSTTQSFTPAVDYFSGNGSTVAFTLSRPVASVAQMIVTIENVIQNPSTAFTVSGSTITFTSAPPSGTNNIWVEYTSLITQTIAPSDGTVNTSQLASSSVTTIKIADANVTPAKLSQPLTQGTSQASTSGTAIDFTGIPSWVKRITVMFSGVSTNGTSVPQIQVGAGSVTTSGYLCGSNYAASGGNSPANYTTGFGLVSANAANVIHGALILTLVTGNTWVANFSFGLSNSAVAINGGGTIALGGTLDRVRITTVNGTDTFDAGSINIMYEG